jgi:hypothetical protein
VSKERKRGEKPQRPGPKAAPAESYPFQVPPTTFMSRGAAQAYLDTCERAGKVRS